jgi:AcrR family transcriptional regulator
MRKVARESGCTIGLINHWFSSKDDLVTAAWQEAALRNDRMSQRVRARGISLRELQRLAATPMLQRRDQAVWLAFNAITIGNRKLHALQADYYQQGRGYLIALLKSAGCSSSRARDVAPAIMAAMDGVLYSAGIEPKFWSTQRQRHVLALLIGHLMPARSGRRSRRP